MLRESEKVGGGDELEIGEVIHESLDGMGSEGLPAALAYHGVYAKKWLEFRRHPHPCHGSCLSNDQS